MPREMTREQKIQHLSEIRMKISTPGRFADGYADAKGKQDCDLTKMPPRDYFEGMDSQAERTDWMEGYFSYSTELRLQDEVDNLKVHTFAEVLALPRKLLEGGNEIYNLLYHNMLEFVGASECTGAYVEDSYYTELSVEEIYFDTGDGERTKFVGLLSYAGVPILLFNAAGRGGYEYTREFILDVEQYKKGMEYIAKTYASVVADEEDHIPLQQVSLDGDAELLLNFYGGRLEIIKD